MAIERNTQGILEAQFTLMEKIIESDELDLSKRVRLFSEVTRGVRSIAGLELEHKKLMVRAPEFAKTAEVRGLQLVEKKQAKVAASE